MKRVQWVLFWFLGLSMAGCGNGWTESQEQEFKDALCSSRSKEVCQCWFDEVSGEYSYEELEDAAEKRDNDFIKF